MKKALLVTALMGVSLAGCKGETGPAGPPGADGTSCNATNNGDGTFTIACPDGNTVTVANGTNGTDGSACSATDNGDGTVTIACTDGSSVTLSNGADGTSGSSCTVLDNHDGTSTIACTDGRSVTIANGADGGNVAVTDFHGADFMQSTGEFATGKYMVKATITGATADPAGVLTVQLAVEDLAGEPVTAVASVSALVAKLAPAPAGEASNVWVPYTTRVETVSTVGDWPNPVGTTALQGSAESNGTFTNHGDGTYTYVFATNLATATGAFGLLVGYDRSLLHRVSVMMGGHDGPTADADLDFVPDGSTPAQTRAIVETAACKACHGEEFHGHGGNRLTVENCATCHTAGMTDANGGESLDLKVMIHKIHAGGELASLPGVDGIVWDNPATTTDESADNGSYAIWGRQNARHEWWKAEFPAVIANCRKCHQGAGAQVDNWKTNPSRAACGSCHDTVDFASGTNHGGGAFANDSLCSVCHTASGSSFGGSVEEAHDWTTKDPRNIPEFVGEITLSPPANGLYYAGSEAPVVTIVLRDAATGAPIDHTAIREDTSAEGCLPPVCPPSDGLFTAASLFVHGPRARRVPVLTTAARAQVFSSSAGPFDVSAAGASLVLKVDGGQGIVMRDASGGDLLASATITVPVSSGIFASGAANATASEIVTWLNGNLAFGRRAIAFLDPSGRIGIRSRNLGTVHAVQLQASAVTTAVFAGDVAAHLPTGSTAGNNTSQRVNPANNDPKASWTSGAIVYQLDPVDDLAPGTYVASIEFGDRGRRSATDYRTPTVAKATFQVKTATAEKPVARNCDSCHQGPDGKGFILDFSRHNKIFSDDALDQCGACHDYQPQLATGTAWSGARPISKRVHAVHFGSSLVTPLLTVDYSNGDPIPGRNWDITFPQDVRNCQACHPDGTSTGTWATAARLPCMGCHDSDAAKAHMKLQTWDLTPADAWSGDEEESCQACH